MAVHAFVISPGSSKGKQIPLMHATFDLTPRNEIGPKFCCLRPKAKYLGITGVFGGLVVEFFICFLHHQLPPLCYPQNFQFSSINLSVYLSIYLFIYQYICLSINLSVYLSFYLFIYQSICLCQSICLSINLSFNISLSVN